MRAPIQQLNVGGRFFDVSPDTLSCAWYFQAHGPFAKAVDDTGRIFIDRSGDLFAIILQYMRTRQRPSQKVLDEFGDDLLDECAYYHYDQFAQVLRGEISPFDMRPEDRSLRAQEINATENPTSHDHELLFNVHSMSIGTRPRGEIGVPLLFDGDDRAFLKDGFEEFYKRLNDWSGSVMDDLAGIPNIVIAGGSVLGSH